MSLQTYPTQEALEILAKSAPSYMHPNHLPIAVWYEGYLSREECEHIKETLDPYKSERHANCNALTREIRGNPVLKNIEEFGQMVNSIYWGYELDRECVTWMQTYKEFGSYQMHMDAAPGRMRKMTAVTLLTDSDWYTGGDLELYFHPSSMRVPRTQGTIVCFPPWILHEVHRIDTGERKSLNTGYWGPNFK